MLDIWLRGTCASRFPRSSSSRDCGLVEAETSDADTFICHTQLQSVRGLVRHDCWTPTCPSATAALMTALTLMT
eukprot:279297-Chlamydomonas_euryale.AAC.9